MSSNLLQPGISHEIVEIVLAESKHTVHVMAEHVRVMSAAFLLPLIHSVVLLHGTLVLSVSEGGYQLAVGSKAASLVTRLYRTVRASLGIPHIKINCSLLLGENAMRKLIKRVRRSIWNAICVQDVVIDFPFRHTVNICLRDIEEVSCNIDW